jgi:hypothetical protein
MSVEKNLRVMETVDEAFNNRDWGSFDDRHAESVVAYDPMNPA